MFLRTRNLHGVYAAAVTPLRPDFRPDLEAIAPFLGFLADRGCHGALLLGTTGEGPSFSPAERLAIWRAALRVREVHPDFRLLAGTGTPSLTETIDLTRSAFELGFDGVVTLPPYYFRSATDEGLFSWFRQLIVAAVPADASLLVYHFPAAAGIGFSMALLRRLKEIFPVQFAGIKDSSHDRAFAKELGETFGSDLAVFSGTDSDFTHALEHHAVGCITAPANILSPELRAVYDLFRRGADASVSQEHVTIQRHLLEKYPPFPPTLKAVLARSHDLPFWHVRPPLVDVPGAVADKIAGELQASSSTAPNR